MDNKALMVELKSPEVDTDQKEMLVMELMAGFAENRDFESILSLIVNIKDFWTDITTARITKIIKKTLQVLPSDCLQNVLDLVTELIAWADRENKKLLKLDLECKKINALLRTGKYSECLESIKKVLRDLKKFDDKENQIRLYIYESRAFYELKDISRARCSLTSARVLAVSSYCPYELQAQIDLLSGMFICDEHQYSTAYSYFLEAIDSFNLSKETQGAQLSTRYLLLSKIIDKKWSEISSIMKSKMLLPFLNDEFIVMLIKIKESCKSRDLKAYQILLGENSNLINMDSFIKSHLYFLYGILFESNILKIIEPYSNIKVDNIAAALSFSSHDVEEKIRKMILDKTINGTIDHVNRSIILFERKDENVQHNDHLEQSRILKEFVSSL